MIIFMISVIIISLPILHLIESMSWSIKAMSNKNNIGYVISRTNIFLYSARFFFFAFNSLTYFLIEKGISEQHLYTILMCCFFITCSLQPLIINKPIIMHASKYVLKTSNNINFIYYLDFKIFLNVLIVNILFVLAIILPILLILSFPEYRLTLSSLAPVLNAIGTAILLFFVDTRLYESMDTEKLHELIFTYMCGRIGGFAFGIILLIYLKIHAVGI